MAENGEQEDGMGGIGTERREVEFEPLPDVPVPDRVPEPAAPEPAALEPAALEPAALEPGRSPT